MLKKIRWRFIQTAMLAFLIVILSLLCLVNVWNCASVTNGQDNILQSLYQAKKDGISGNTPLERIGQYSNEVPYMIRFFSVEYNNDIEVFQEYIASLSEKEAIEYGNTIKAKNKNSGYYNGYRYLKVVDDDNTIILFLNSEREVAMMKSLLLITLIIALVSLFIVFCLITFFSKYAIAPYLKNIERQKQFITNASHELKTPLTSICTSGEVLKMEYENNEWIDNILFQSNKLSKLISSLVILSRLDEEEPFLKKEIFSISDALWEVLYSFKTLALGQNKNIIISIEDNLTFNGDKDLFQQCISILLDNALKYSCDNGNIEVCANKKGKKIEIIVSNDYDGQIKEIDRLFERFYRDDTSHSNSISGSGIGLSIAKAIVDRLNGDISVLQCEKKVNFTLTL